MKKIIAVLCLCAALTAGICAIPDAAVSAAPSACVISPKNVMYSETLTSCGSLSYIGQSDVTSSLPLIIERYNVSEGEHIEAGEVIAMIDKEGSASFIESLGQLPQLAVAASNLSTAVSLIPSEITADRTGTVISTAEAGSAVEAGSSICTIAGTEELVITAPVSEQYISYIEEGEKISFTLAAYPEETFTGKVRSIAAGARNRYSGSVLETVVDVTVSPDSFDERFKTGLSADVTFTLTEPKSICVLSYDAIGQDEGGEYVYVYEDEKAIRRRIFTGAEFYDGTEIIKGVTAEELVFTSPEDIPENSFIRVE